VRGRFDILRGKLGQDDKYADLRERLNAAETLLQEGQQAPMRASQEGGWLSSLIILKDTRNREWWRRVARDLKNTRRGYTFSTIAQVAMALLAYVLSIISTYLTNLGTVLTVEYYAGGSLWVWMIPIICGWIWCGVQASYNSIEDSLTAHNAIVARDTSVPTDAPDTEARQLGILCRSGLTPRPERRIDGGDLETYELGRASKTVATYRPIIFNASVEGHEKCEGPIFNYARVFTWWQFARTLEKSFDDAINHFEYVGEGVSLGREAAETDALNPEPKTRAGEVAEFCGLNRFLDAYPNWQDVDGEVQERIIRASTLAMVIQWGTTGPAIMVGYLTPTKGLGCRSSSYLIYGLAGTLAWILLLISSYLSHASMLEYQSTYTGEQRGFSKKAWAKTGRKTRTWERGSLANSAEYTEIHPMQDLEQAAPAPLMGQTRPHITDISLLRPRAAHAILNFFTVVTRILGEAIAGANACWIVLSAFFEFTASSSPATAPRTGRNTSGSRCSSRRSSCWSIRRPFLLGVYVFLWRFAWCLGFCLCLFART
jgi:hypothetical protein